MTTIYGIKNCDTMKKAQRWLNDNNVTYVFHDYRKDGLTHEQVEQWIEVLGWENLINKRGTTWRQLDKTQQENMTDELAISVLLDKPAMIKRPLLDHNGTLTLGFKPEQYSEIFGI
ncbi:ArsC family reductase [Marinomonas piezotolerans]|uniref:ArsC family reductase n=1 Tax=Marinomonas piezotolerans TaxID=2213058 RepID=A0A370UAD6_9GAMM|nr:ArsC family reductase [Marinomonas piezotolerans]RDL44733.1 ArsC family reductase [Marinomonas piezotolerans]